jgi:hypothetical protein
MQLTSTEVEQLGCLGNAKPLITDLLNDFEAMQFFLRHGDQKGHDDSDRSWSRPSSKSSSLLPTLVLTSASRGETVASLTGPTFALLNLPYTPVRRKQIYGTLVLKNCF